MFLECPHCQANYDITQGVADTVFVCHQCGQEFSEHAKPVAEQPHEPVPAHPWQALQWQSISHGFAAPPWLTVNIFAPSVALEKIAAADPVADTPHGNEAAANNGDIAPIEAEQAPSRKAAHIWPWLLTILILLASAGFWVQKDAWLDNRRLRSTLINIGIDMPLRAKDWRIIPASVQPEWMTRKDGGRMLSIRGDIKNLLSSDMTLPRIKITFFSKTEPEKQIGASTLEIVLSPSGKQSNQGSSQSTVRDTAPVSALGRRSFTIIAESVPGETGDFMLTPAFH